MPPPLFVLELFTGVIDALLFLIKKKRKQKTGVKSNICYGSLCGVVFWGLPDLFLPPLSTRTMQGGGTEQLRSRYTSART